MQTAFGTILALIMLFGSTQISVSGQESEQGDLREEQSERVRQSVEGVWRTVVTPRNCQTGDPIPVPPIRGLFTFNEGGTLAEWGVAANSSPALRSPGHGLWEQRSGRRNYSFTFIHLRYDGNGVFLGSQKITAALTLGASGNSFTTNSAIEILDANDNVVGTGCATAVGTRFE